MENSTELTDEQILASLFSRRDKLKIQLEKVMVAISAFEGDDKKSYDIAHQKSNESIAQSSYEDDKQYSDLTTFTDKILFYITKYKKGYVNDIVSYIMLQEPNKYNEADLHHRITQTASRLYGKKKLDAERIGRKFHYKHKKAD